MADVLASIKGRNKLTAATQGGSKNQESKFVTAVVGGWAARRKHSRPPKQRKRWQWSKCTWACEAQHRLLWGVGCLLSSKVEVCD